MTFRLTGERYRRWAIEEMRRAGGAGLEPAFVNLEATVLTN